IAESSLSFLGLGVQPPTPSWGAMIADGRDLSQLRHAPWTSLFPGLAIGAAVLGFNLLGDALRDALDPRAVRAAVPRGAGLAAFALPLGTGDVVLTPDREFPANVYPWMQLARARGVIYRRVPTCDGAVDEEALHRELEDPAVRAVSVSWVGFASGYAVDLEAIGRA